MMSATYRVEFARLHENGSWDTEVVDVPLDVPDNRGALGAWAEETLMSLCVYRRYVLIVPFAWPID